MDNNHQNFSQSQAIQALQVETPPKPKAASLYIKQAYTRLAQGDIEGAMSDDNLQNRYADFNLAISSHPNSAELYAARANFRRKKLGDRLGAIEDYTQAIFINPDNAFFYFWRSQTYQELGNQQQAIQDYNAAVTLAPEGTMYCLI